MTTSRALDRLEERVGELLAARRAARTDFSEYRDAPVRFMREILSFHPTAKQVEVIQSVLEHKRTHVRGHHGAGKDAVLAALLLWACYGRGMLCLAISATEKQLLGQLWSELSRLWSDAKVLPGELYVGELRINEEKRIRGLLVGRSTSHLTGHHNHTGAGVFVAISESQAEHVGDVAFDAAEGNTAGAGSKIVVVGNPVRAEGRFYEVSKRPSWSAIRMSAFDHPNVQEGRVVVPGGPSPDWPDEMAAEYGTDSAFYVSRVLAEFPTEGSVDSLVTRDQIDAAMDRHDPLGPLAPWPIPVLTLDVARSVARDESMAALTQGSAVHSLSGWRVRDLTVTTDRFLRVAARSRLAWYLDTRASSLEDKDSPVVRDTEKLLGWLDRMGVPAFETWVDAPGVGGGVVDDLRRRGHDVHEWWGWNPPEDGKRFANVRAEASWGVRKLLEADQAALPRDELLAEDLLALEWSLDGKGRIQILAKEEVRKSLGRSPDRGDVVVMGLAAGTGKGPTGDLISFGTAAM